MLIASQLYASDLSIHGSLQNYMGVLPTQDFDYSILQNTFDLTLDYYGDNSAVHLSPSLTYDFDTDLSVGLTEAYIDMYSQDVDVRIGKQQIIYGKADGVFITDVVSPKNLSEFLLPDFDEIRLGVTAVKVDYYRNDATYELVWIPLFTPNTMPEADSIWNVNGIDFGDSTEDIDASLENSEIFGKYSLYSSTIDFDIMSGSMWDDEPTITTDGDFTHHRMGIIGGSFSTTVHHYIIRGEGAWNTGKYVNATLEMDYLHYMVGIDTTVNSWNLSAQFIEKVYLDYEDNTSVDQWQNTITLMANKEFYDNTILFEIFTYIEFDEINALIRPKVTYSLSDDITVMAGCNIFLGDSGTYGQFDDNSMLYTKIKLSF
jgi:hypothetical protein